MFLSVNNKWKFNVGILWGIVNVLKVIMFIFGLKKRYFFFKYRYFVNNIVIDMVVNMEYFLKNKRLILFFLMYLRNY